MNSKMISAWLDYCSGETAYDESDFLGLLSSRPSTEQIELIFEGFPHKESIITNLRYIFGRASRDATLYLRPKQENAVEAEQLREMVEEFVSYQRKILLECDIHDVSRAWIESFSGEAEIIGYHELRKRDPNDNRGHYFIDEEMRLRVFDKGLNGVFAKGSTMERKLAGIEEAMYGLACDYYISWYILSPLYLSPIVYDQYIAFWSAGGVFDITDSKILVSSIW